MSVCVCVCVSLVPVHWSALLRFTAAQTDEEREWAVARLLQAPRILTECRGGAAAPRDGRCHGASSARWSTTQQRGGAAAGGDLTTTIWLLQRQANGKDVFGCTIGTR
jgi:hypothetical protein